MGSRLSVSDLVPRCRQAAWVCGVVVALWAGVAEAGPPKPKKAAARKHFDRAVELYSTEDYAAAAEQARRGYEIEAHESLLFIQAQAERKAGNCIEAVGLLDAFIEATSDESMRDNALTAKAMCAEELAEAARQAQADLEEMERLKAEEEAQKESEEEDSTPAPVTSTERPWYRDPMGDAFVGVGAAVVLAGGGVLIAGVLVNPDDATDHEAYGVEFDKRNRLLLAGGITAGVGGALVVVGAVRWGLVARKGKAAQADSSARANIGVGPWLGGRGLSVMGRF